MEAGKGDCCCRLWGRANWKKLSCLSALYMGAHCLTGYGCFGICRGYEEACCESKQFGVIDFRTNITEDPAKKAEIHEIEYLGSRFAADVKGLTGVEPFSTLMLLEPMHPEIEYYLKRNCISLGDDKISDNKDISADDKKKQEETRKLKQEAANSLRYLCAKDSIKVLRGTENWESSPEELVKCLSLESKMKLMQKIRTEAYKTDDDYWLELLRSRQEENIQNKLGQQFGDWWNQVGVFGSDETRLQNGDYDTLLVRKLKAILGLVWEENMVKESKVEKGCKSVRNPKINDDFFTIEITKFDAASNSVPDAWRRNLLAIVANDQYTPTTRTETRWFNAIEYITWQDINRVEDLIAWREKYRWSDSIMCMKCDRCVDDDNKANKIKRKMGKHIGCWRCTALCTPNILEPDSGEDTEAVIRHTEEKTTSISAQIGALAKEIAALKTDTQTSLADMKTSIGGQSKDGQRRAQTAPSNHPIRVMKPRGRGRGTSMRSMYLYRYLSVSSHVSGGLTVLSVLAFAHPSIDHQYLFSCLPKTSVCPSSMLRFLWQVLLSVPRLTLFSLLYVL
jgi:hypothetical protein